MTYFHDCVELKMCGRVKLPISKYDMLDKRD